MPLLLLQLSLIVIFIHAVYHAVLDVQNGLKTFSDWIEFLYQLAIAVAAAWFYYAYTF
ncbi:hypothetical protein MK805_11090 [Shimazuella sp. AN120528]|uniref:hypothetical protein n=1 Tax=Shimazuella soli TaxID=1892854 RepID=UPI001F0DEBEF|nr:hypothetical protein [Shimazuella soli]MCH5585497.1 hypothetical protein [Shimazuella soli]